MDSPALYPESRARALMKPYVDAAGVVGIYLTGSSVRPHRDAYSDLDLHVVMEDDAYAKMGERQKQVIEMRRDGSHRKDYELYFLSCSDLEGFASSPRDVDHFRYLHARILHDPSGRLAEVFARIPVLPESERLDRCRVHYFELVWFQSKAMSCLERGDGLGARLLAGGAVASCVRLLFAALGSWAPGRQWTRAEMLHAGIPTELAAQMERALGEPAELKALVAQTDQWLDAHGLSLHRNRIALAWWANLSPEGKAALRRFGTAQI